MTASDWSGEEEDVFLELEVDGERQRSRQSGSRGEHRPISVERAFPDNFSLSSNSRIHILSGTTRTSLNLSSCRVDGSQWSTSCQPWFRERQPVVNRALESRLWFGAFHSRVTLQFIFVHRGSWKEMFRMGCSYRSSAVTASADV